MTGLGLKWPGDGVAASVLQGMFVKFSAGGGFRHSNFETRRTKAIEPPGPRQQRHENQTMDEKVGAQVARVFVWAAVRTSPFYHVVAMVKGCPVWEVGRSILVKFYLT
jgi:hypothetical protein